MVGAWFTLRQYVALYVVHTPDDWQLIVDEPPVSPYPLAQLRVQLLLYVYAEQENFGYKHVEPYFVEDGQ